MDTTRQAEPDTEAPPVLAWWRRSRTVLLGAFLLVVVAVGSAEVVDVFNDYRQARAAALTARTAVAAAVAHATEALVGHYRRLVDTTARAIFDGALPATSRHQLLRAIRQTHPEIDGIIVLDPKGRVIDADEVVAQLMGRDLSDRAYYQQIAGGAPTVVGDLVLSRASGIASVPVAAGRRGPAGELRGVVVLGVRAATLAEHLALQLSGDAYPVVVDRSGRLIFHGAFPDLDWEQRDFSRVSVVAEALAGRPALWTGFRSPLTNQARIGAMVPVPELGWAVGVLQPVETALAPARRALRAALSEVVVVLVLGVALALSLGLWLSRPIGALAAGAAALAGGDLAHRVRVGRRDEFGWLAEAFNRMATRLEEARRQERQLTDELTIANEDLQANMAQLEETLSELELQRGRFEAVLTQMPAGVIVADAPSGRFLLTNAQAAEILRRPAVAAADVDGYGTFQGFHPDGRPYRPEEWPLARSIRAGEVVTDEEIGVVRGDGTRATIRVSSGPVRDREGRIVAAVVTFYDVTERRQLEQQLRQAQKMEAVGKLAGGVAHDFNNLLTAIIGYSDLLLADRTEDRTLLNDVEEIRKAADRAAALTRQLLAFSRQQVLEPKVLDLNAVVADMGNMLKRLIGEDIDLVVVPAAGLGRVKVDPSQMEQVLLNLAVNARDAMPEGGKLTIETANAELDETYAKQHLGAQPGASVMLAVSDTGCGMTPEVQARIFEPFFTTKPEGKGTGLGLSTVYGIVKQSGGNIWVYSEPGHGTTFKVYLPRVEDSLEPRARAVAPTKPAGGHETILLVEDDAGVRALARRVLQAAGYTVLEARDGEEALSLSESHKGPISLMLTDMVMPGASGRHLAERLVARRPETKIVYMSGYTDTAILRQQAFEPGTAFLGKPFAPAALARKVREVLDGGAKP